MSLDLLVYAPQVSDTMIPQLVKGLNEFNMVCEIHPGFSFNDHSGYLPFKFELLNPKFDILKGKQLRSGFELYTGDFNLDEEKQKLNAGQSLLKRVFSRPKPFASAETDKKLQGCKKLVTLVWHTGDSFEFRFTLLTAAILTKLTNGICCYPADDIWYDTRTITEVMWKEIQNSEDTITNDELEFCEFQSW